MRTYIQYKHTWRNMWSLKRKGKKVPALCLKRQKLGRRSSPSSGEGSYELQVGKSQVNVGKPGVRSCWNTRPILLLRSVVSAGRCVLGDGT